jgi:hypothetical protein
LNTWGKCKVKRLSRNAGKKERKKERKGEIKREGGARKRRQNKKEDAVKMWYRGAMKVLTQEMMRS